MSFANRRPVDTIDRRVGLLFGVFLLLMLIAGARAAYLGILRGPALKQQADLQEVQHETIPGMRGEITDRNGVALALTESAYMMYADPEIIQNPQKVATEIAPLLGISLQNTLKALTKTGTGYSPLAPDVPNANATKIMAMRINGINDTAVSERVYPRGSSAMQVLGWMHSDGKGAGGLEHLYNKQLEGTAGKREIVNNAKGQAIAVDNVKPMVPGKNLKLTISAPLQAEVEQALAQVGKQYDPKDATAIAMNPDNGQILALANWPAANADDITSEGETEDYGVGLTYEPGSTFKAITVAGALSDGVVTPSTEIYVPSELHYSNQTIHDAEDHPDEDLTVANVLKVSSNIGADQIAAKEGATKFNYWMHRFGFGKPTGVDLPGEQQGIVPAMKDWNPASMGTFPFGQGISVTPIQMMQAYSAIANGGVLRTPSIVESVGGKKVPEAKGKHVITPQVASELRDMLRGVLADGGTASGAQIYGYDLAGKTGTANIVVPGSNTYSTTKYMASFIGMVPASNPKLVVAVIVDEPQGSIYGGSVAAPAFKQIVGWAVPYFGINPCPSPCPATAYQNATPSTP